MTDIRPESIGNSVGQICDAVLGRLLPALNEANQEIRNLQGRIAALEESGAKASKSPPVAQSKTKHAPKPAKSKAAK